MAVMILLGDEGKARENEDDRKLKTQEGRAGDSWTDSFFLDKDVPYVPDHSDQTQSDVPDHSDQTQSDEQTGSRVLGEGKVILRLALLKLVRWEEGQGFG